ncbi:MAG: GNAT family N-acetyltransferase [Burkholderiaceae bacterium]|nr:GNAT family N-acetyltransferase [Burkholderiaceae bacterium]
MPGHECPVDERAFLYQIEPGRLIDAFLTHPPQGFVARTDEDGTPAFIAPFDILTTLAPEVRRRLMSVPLLGRWLSRWRVPTVFVGTTVTEYAPLSADLSPAMRAARWRYDLGRRFPLCVVKDLPQSSPLLGARDNADANLLVAACRDAGFIVLAGQSLAYVPIDFASIDDYLARLSSGRRKDLRRKLRTRDALEASHWRSGDARYDRDALIDQYYALYAETYAQSEIQFDRLTRPFLAAILRDPENGGVCFEYRENGELLGFNLCFERDGMLIDKYIGLRYPAARHHNLYFVSWFVNLEYALKHGMHSMVAGWTDPQVKAALGASFTYTRHAVFIRHPVLRLLGRWCAHWFDGDSAVQAVAQRNRRDR